MPFDVFIDDTSLHPVITLKDTESSTHAEIYTFGAILNKFVKVHEGQEMNIVDGFASVEEAKDLITPAFKGAKLSPFVCRIKDAAYHFGEADHELTKYVVSGSALHGLVFDRIFSVVSTEGTDSYAKVILEYNYATNDEGYPFVYRCEVEYCLWENNELTLKTVVTNNDEKLIPIADGWHPYFTLGGPIDECQLEFQSKEIMEFTQDLLPTGKLVPYQEFGSIATLGTTTLDNCFTVNFAECQPLVVFRNPKKKIELEIYPERSYPYLQIFTPPHRNSLAIENLSAAPDVFNNFIGLHVLEPKESISFATKYVIKSL